MKSIYRFWVAILVLMASSFLLTSCGLSNFSDISSIWKTDLLTDSWTLAKAQQDFLNLPSLKGKKINVFQDIYFYREHISLSIQNPDNPKNIDSYEWRNGKWSDPQPVQISGKGDMSDNVFPISEVKFQEASTVYANYIAKAKTVEGVKLDDPSFVVMFRLIVMNGTREWYTDDISGTREKYSIKYNLDGSVNSFKKN